MPPHPFFWNPCILLCWILREWLLKFSILVVFNDRECINVQELQNITPKSLTSFINTFVWICNNCHVKGFSTFIINFPNCFLQSLNSSSQIIDLGQDNKKIPKRSFNVSSNLKKRNLFSSWFLFESWERERKRKNAQNNLLCLLDKLTHLVAIFSFFLAVHNLRGMHLSYVCWDKILGFGEVLK
jgi:hypothetical protein